MDGGYFQIECVVGVDVLIGGVGIFLVRQLDDAIKAIDEIIHLARFPAGDARLVHSTKPALLQIGGTREAGIPAPASQLRAPSREDEASEEPNNQGSEARDHNGDCKGFCAVDSSDGSSYGCAYFRT